MNATPPPAPQRTPAATKNVPAPTAGSDLTAALGEERELWRGRMSWKHQAGHLLVWTAAAIVLIWVWAHFHQPDSSPWFGRVVLLLILGSGAGLFARSALTVYRTRYRLTTQRLFIEQGILGKTIDQTELYRVDDVRTHQSFLDRIFGVGDVELLATSESTQPALRLVGIADPNLGAEHVRANSRALRMKRSLFGEQM